VCQQVPKSSPSWWGKKLVDRDEGIDFKNSNNSKIDAR
jgi:hypothetical protein